MLSKFSLISYGAALRHARRERFSFFSPIELCSYFHSSSRLVIDVANKTNEFAGDGTTTATVLTRAIYSEGVKNVAAGCNPMDLRRGTQKAVEHVIAFLEKNKQVITTSDQIAQVCLLQYFLSTLSVLTFTPPNLGRYHFSKR